MLILVFSFFSVGIPVVQYLCPMMSAENPRCEMSPVSIPGLLTVSSITPDCCAKQVGAERNTTPYLKVEKLQKLNADLALTTTTVVGSCESASRNRNTPLFCYSTFSPPLFVLHSAFLI